MSTQFTLREWQLLPEGFPAQLLDGSLVKEPSPTYGHQALSAMLHVQLVGLVGPRLALAAPCDVVLDDTNVFQPDLLVIRTPPAADANDVGIPRLAIEIASPSTRTRDAGYKRRRLLEAGAGEVWIVDPARGEVHRYDADGQVSATGAERIASRVVPGFDVVPDELFR